MKKPLVILAALFFSVSAVKGQARFYSGIKVEFEKTTSVRQLQKDLANGDSWFEQNKERWPVSSLSYYNFTGDTSHSVYKPGKEVPLDPRSWWRPFADKNVVYNDYKKGTTVTQKPVFEETFLLEDSLLKVKWKITADRRTIAGFDCRKAIGVLNDTIAIFAFYTDELLVNGGPEGINGLPGMILGMGIPRLHATWFATKVEVSDPNLKEVVVPSKGKKVNRSDLMTRLTRLAKEWGSYGSKMLVNFVI